MQPSTGPLVYSSRMMLRSRAATSALAGRSTDGSSRSGSGGCVIMP
jgi:hypothetical protein